MRKFGVAGVIALGVAFAGFSPPLHAPSPAAAVDLDLPVVQVTSGADSGPGSLRAALEAEPDGVKAVIDAGLEISLESELVYTGETLELAVADGGRATMRVGSPAEAEFGRHLVARNLIAERIDFAASADWEGEWPAAGGLFVAEGSFAHLRDLTFQGLLGAALVSRHDSDHDWPATTVPDPEFIISDIRVEDSSWARTRPAVLELRSPYPVRLSDSTFVDNVGIVDIQTWSGATAAGIEVENNVFEGWPGSAVEERRPGCVNVSAVGSFAGAAGSEVSLVVKNNQISRCGVPEENSLFEALQVTMEGWGGASESSVEISGNTFFDNIGRDVRDLNVRDFSDEEMPKTRWLIENNTMTSSGADGTAAMSLVMPTPGAWQVRHNTVVGKGIQIMDDYWNGGGSASSSVRLENNAVDAGGEPAVVVDSAISARVDLSGAGNVVTVPGDLPEGSFRVAPAEEFRLGELAANGSLFTPLTMLPGEGSVLIDAGVASESLPVTDQRGLPRVIGAAPDAGAVEWEEPVVEPAVVSIGEDVSVVEGAPAVFTVTRAGNADVAASVVVSTADDTAKAGRDYVALSETVSWEPGETAPKQVTVVTTTQDPVDADRAFTVTVSEPGEGVELGERVVARGTITDEPDDAPGTGPGTGPGAGDVEPPVTSPGGGLSETGGGSNWGLLAAAGAVVVAGLGALAWSRRRHRGVK